MRALALVGPRASEATAKLFLHPNVAVTQLSTANPEEVEGVLNGERPDVALIFGGDGTVNIHLNQLANTGIPVLVVPCGSGNDLARVAGTRSVNAALQAWKSFAFGEQAPTFIDLGRIFSPNLLQPRYFSCCANVGLDAEAARRADRLPDWLKSHGGYFAGGLMALACYQPRELSVRALEKHTSGRNWFVSISNTPTFGGGLKIAPQASVTDARLDVTLVSAERFSRAMLATHFPKIFSGRHVEIPGLEMFQSTDLEIETPSPQPVYADGECITHTPCRIAVAPGALRLVCTVVR